MLRELALSKIDQVKKVYGISDSVFALILPFLRADAINPVKLDLNTVTWYVLSERTGVSGDVARGIVSFRQQYGLFQTVNDLKKIVFFNDSLRVKILPHVEIR